MSRGKLFEPLSEGFLQREILGIYSSETELLADIQKRLQEAKESFLKIDPITDDALLDSIYDWFLKYFGEVK